MKENKNDRKNTNKNFFDEIRGKITENRNNNLKIIEGIELNRVINKEYLSSLGDFYKCSICSKIMVNPTDCEGCGHSYCNECISNSNCPFGCQKKSFKPASMGIRNLLNNLKFNCTNEGCMEIISYIDVLAHDNTCGYQKMICPNQNCEKQIIKKDLENHIKNECKFTLIQCKNCNYEFPRGLIGEHEKNCSTSFQSFSSFKMPEMNKLDSNQYIQALSINIAKILKDNKILKENISNCSNININHSINNYENNNNLNSNLNESNENNNSRVSYRESLAQIEEDDLIDLLKKAIEEKLIERFSCFDNSFNKIFKDLKEIKNFVCKMNIIKEVKESEEEENDEEENKPLTKEKKSSSAIKEIENDIFDENENTNEKNKVKLNNIKIYLKELIDKSEIEIKKSIQKLTVNLFKESYRNNVNKTSSSNNKERNENNNNKINKEKKINNNNYNKNFIINNKIVLIEINEKIDDITNKIIEKINETNISINNINESLKNNINILVTSLNNQRNNQDENKNNELEKVQNNINIHDNITEKIKDFLKGIIENNNKDYYNKIETLINYKIINYSEFKENELRVTKENKGENSNNINNSNINDLIDKNDKFKEVKSLISGYEKKYKEENNYFEKNNIMDKQQNIINEQKEKIIKFKKEILDEQKKIINRNKENKAFQETKEEIYDNISSHFKTMNKNISNANYELKSIKNNTSEITHLMSEQFEEIINLINSNIIPNKNNNNNIIRNNNNNSNLSNFAIEEEKGSVNSSAEIKNYSNEFSFKLNYEEKRGAPVKNDNIKNEVFISKEKLKKKFEVSEIGNNKSSKNEDKKLIDNNSFNSGQFEGCKNNEKLLNSLFNIESKINFLDSYAKEIPDKIKDKINYDFEKNMVEFGKKIEYDIDSKIKDMFSLKYCVECEKVDYFYGFMKCSNCLNENCKQCISLCLSCKHLLCKKCCSCPKCIKLFCVNCRYLCNFCSSKYCPTCFSSCSLCLKQICNNCIKSCSSCKIKSCDSCSKTCNICSKNCCEKCQLSFNIINCLICNKYICEKCYISCSFCLKEVCKNCIKKCIQCKKMCCNFCSRECSHCNGKFCEKCSSDFDKVKCNICKKIFCFDCAKFIVKCKECNSIICKFCSCKCSKCKGIFCKNYYTICIKCNDKFCNDCIAKCICQKVRYCGKCMEKEIEISPHECIFFLNNSSSFSSLKTRSKIKLYNNFEVKLFLEKKSLNNNSFIGLTNNHNFSHDTVEVIKNTWTISINTGEKFSSEKSGEKYLDANFIKESCFIYIMKKDQYLYFKINENEYKLAFILPKNDYYIYLENRKKEDSSTIKFVYIKE